jgi:hypothetical protein
MTAAPTATTTEKDMAAAILAELQKLGFVKAAKALEKELEKRQWKTTKSSAAGQAQLQLVASVDTVKKVAAALKKQNDSDSSSSDSSDEEEDAKPVTKKTEASSNKGKNDSSDDDDSSDDSSDDEEAAAEKPKPPAVTQKIKQSAESSSDDDDSSDESSKPPAKKARTSTTKITAKKTPEVVTPEEEDSDSDVSDVDVSDCSSVSTTSSSSDDSDDESESSESESEDEGDAEKRKQDKKKAAALKNKKASEAALAWTPKLTPTHAEVIKITTTRGSDGAQALLSEGKPFQRVDDDYWGEKAYEGGGAMADNSYGNVFGNEGFGAKASEKLLTVRGKKFQHEKTKRKRSFNGMARGGGTINMESNSTKY